MSPFLSAWYAPQTKTCGKKEQKLVDWDSKSLEIWLCYSWDLKIGTPPNHFRRHLENAVFFFVLSIPHSKELQRLNLKTNFAGYVLQNWWWVLSLAPIIIHYCHDDNNKDSSKHNNINILYIILQCTYTWTVTILPLSELSCWQTWLPQSFPRYSISNQLI